MLKKMGIGSVLIALSPLLPLIYTSIGSAIQDSTEGLNTTRCMFAEDGVTSLSVNPWGLVPSFLLIATAEILVIASSKYGV